MNISGSGHIAAGEYNEKISVSGSATINGNVRCTAFSSSGSVRGLGSIVCDEDVRVSGSCHFEKNVCADSIKSSGSLRVDADISATANVSTSGALSCKGNIKCSLLESSGSLEVSGEIAADEVRVSGRIICAGLINAEKTDISLESFNTLSRVGSIGGSDIRVHNYDTDKKSFRLPLLSKLAKGALGTGRLIVDELVEGDTVALENVSAPCVVGRAVTIGKGCEIDLVRYSEELEIHPDAKVAKSEKI